MTEEKIDQNFRSRQLELGSWSWLLDQVITFFKQSFGFVFAWYKIILKMFSTSLQRWTQGSDGGEEEDGDR